jgi:hypothetical protein
MTERSAWKYLAHYFKEPRYQGMCHVISNLVSFGDVSFTVSRRMLKRIDRAVLRSPGTSLYLAPVQDHKYRRRYALRQVARLSRRKA